MDQKFLRQTIIDRMRRHGENLDRAAESISRGMGLNVSDMTLAVDSIRREGRRNMLLDSPPGVFKHDGSLEAEARISGWYSGPEEGDQIWPRLRAKLESTAMSDVIDEIDRSSTKVVAHLADPHIQNLSKRGLVLGYVQSGKTANYTAVMAKAADAGYCLFIVLSGLHNNLRRQTQVRLDNDIVDDDWVPLTSDTADFGNILHGSAILSGGVKSIAVVKKNQARLLKLRNWLRDIPIEIRRRTPILLLDDEADQATPNSASNADQLSRINQLIREIWSEIPTGTYVGYTATPFANIFMNPNDTEDLYPADFILDLPRPDAYFGAERLFGREPRSDADNPDPGLDMIREISDDDAAALRPPTNAGARELFDPGLPASLIEATTWFVVATAIRRCRGQANKHSSMLVHTTHYVQPHFALKRKLGGLVDQFTDSLRRGDLTGFKTVFEKEAARAAEVATLPLPNWDQVASEMHQVVHEVRIVVDNGESEDRLDYGIETAETVIAVGGGTLSRGLTLEGLIVSYFTRTSNTYDTLLQMGRWFGYRPGYEDLPRVWMQPSLADEFRFLALVEEELRQDIADMELQQMTPRELGVRVRAHPGRLSIVARNKMRHASVVQVTYSGQRLQTFIFSESNHSIISSNKDAVSNFIGRHSALWTKAAGQRWLARDISSDSIIKLLKDYEFHPNQAGMRPDHMVGWIERAAPNSLWNAIVIGNSRKHKRPDGSIVELGQLNLGPLEGIQTINRAPLVMPSAEEGVANIKALMSHDDWFADINRSVLNSHDSSSSTPRNIRRDLSSGRGLLAIYPISKDSIPMGASVDVGTRRHMEARDHIIGLGIVFPETDVVGYADSGNYFSVSPDWQWKVDDGDESFPQDLEDDLDLDGEDVVVQQS